MLRKPACGTRAGARRGESNPNFRRRTAGPTGGDTGQPSSRKTLSLARQVQGGHCDPFRPERFSGEPYAALGSKVSKKAVASSLKLFKRAASTTLRYLPYETKKYKPRHPGPRGSGELGEDHHSQQFYLAG